MTGRLLTPRLVIAFVTMLLIPALVRSGDSLYHFAAPIDEEAERRPRSE